MLVNDIGHSAVRMSLGVWRCGWCMLVVNTSGLRSLHWSIESITLSSSRATDSRSRSPVWETLSMCVHAWNLYCSLKMECQRNRRVEFGWWQTSQNWLKLYWLSVSLLWNKECFWLFPAFWRRAGIEEKVVQEWQLVVRIYSLFSTVYFKYNMSVWVFYIYQNMFRLTFICFSFNTSPIFIDWK